MRQFSKNKFLVLPEFPSDQLHIAVEILKTTNCRVSEVLSAQWSDFFPDERLILSGKKKSSNVILHDRIILRAIGRLPVLDKEKIFPSINYYHVYHYCKQHYSHLFIKWRKKKNYKVTHGFRYRAVEKVANEEKIRDILHHRSTKSGKFYK